MSLVDNKQLIHIISEIVVISGISSYFAYKNKLLEDRIEELENKLSQQQEILQNHENVLLQLINNVSDMKKSTPPSDKKLPKNLNTSKKVSIIVQPPPPEPEPEPEPEISDIIDILPPEPVEHETKVEEILDEELEEELRDLE